MDKREEGLLEIEDRIRTDREASNLLGIKQWRRSPTTSLDNCPILIMLEDEDVIVKKSARHLYPVTRDVEIILELIVNKNDDDVRALIRALRKIIFKDGVKVAEGVYIEERRAIGPFGYGVPDILGMRLILGMKYTDNGN